MGIHPLSPHERANYLDTLKLLSETTPNYLFFWDLIAGHLYFPRPVHERYALPAPTEGYHTIQDLKAAVRDQDLPAFQEKLDALLQGTLTTLDMGCRLRDPNGNDSWTHIHGKVLLDGSGRPEQMTGWISDMVLELRADPLTGLLNSEKLQEDLEGHLAQNEHGCLLLLDIDDFRSINRKQGKGFGNHVLRQMGEILEQSAQPSMGVYHLEGDCFAIDLTGGSQDAAEKLFSRILERSVPQYTLSAGASLYGGDWAVSGDLVRQYAETALERAKGLGAPSLLFSSAEDLERSITVIDLQEELRRSIANGFEGFYLCYQPQISSLTYQSLGAEALLRYDHPSRGKVSPGEFVPILEQTGMICEVGEWVLKTALAQCARWRQQIPQFHISINLSYVQLRKKDIVETVLGLLERSGLPGSALTLEVTESMQLQDSQYFNRLFYQWQNAGIRISIDDFGSGYSSLSYLKSIEVDETKIDRCFVSRIQHSAYNHRLLSNMIQMAHNAKIRVCCEGVETVDELLALKELQPDLLQGYLFSEPYEAARFEEAYIKKEGPAYQARLQKEACLNGLDPGSAPQPQSQDGEDPQAIVQALDEVIYVCGLDNFELYYLNPAGCSLTGQQDHRGRKCYKVLYGRDDPCLFCTLAGGRGEASGQPDLQVQEVDNAFLGRHFIVKGKTIPWHGGMAHLGVAIDMTEKEVATRGVKQQLDSEQLLTACSKTLIEETDLDQAIMQVLGHIGAFYNGDRAYLTQPTQDGSMWRSTAIWRREGLTAEEAGCPLVPAAWLRPWILEAREGVPVVIANTDALKQSDPQLWELLHRHQVRRLFSAPIWMDKKPLGFLQVEGPRQNLKREAQLCSLAGFLADRLAKDDTEKRLNELLACRYEDILQNTCLGLWVIRIDQAHDHHEMFADRIMRQIMGIPETASPAECYHHWYDRINDGYFHYVNLAIESMTHSPHIVEMEYTWNHPEKGELMVRCLGLRVADSEGCIYLEGYQRVLSGMERPRFLPDGTSSEMFEFNERKGSIYFHTGRKFLAGDALREEDFPECWIRTGIVHPHFADSFRSLFVHLEKKEDLLGAEFLLRSKSGTYEWFKLKTRHIGQKEQDLNTIIVLIDPAGQERAMELEYMRMSDFYKAMLSETAAYAEVDVESGLLQTAGGLWAPYEEECRRLGQPFSQVLERHIEEVVHEEHVDHYRQLLSTESMTAISRDKDVTRTYSFLRKVGEEYRWMELVVHIFKERFSENIYALLYLKDINEEKNRELAQEFAASRDPLTNVYNRKTFSEKVTSYMTEEEAPSGALVILDLDDFKTINDTYGHLEGDHALKTLTQVLLATFRRRDIIGRLGGDEFLVFIKDMTEQDILDKRMEQFYESLHKAGKIPLTCSVGIALVYPEGFSYEKSLEQADHALYYSKEHGKDRYTYHHDLGQASDQGGQR